MKEHEVTFYTMHGIQLVGEIWMPEDYVKGQKRAALINIPGYSCIYHLGYYVDISERLAKAGYVVLSFDYRGYGKSGSPSGPGSKDVTMVEEAEDVMSAVSYLQTRPEVDPKKIGIVGNSLGGSVCVYAAAMDKRLKAIIANWGIGDGERWFRSLSRLPEWNDMVEELEEDRRRRVLTGKPKLVHYLQYMKLAGEEAEGIKLWEKNGWIGVMLPATFIESIISFKPELVVDLISPRPILFAHPEAEEAVSYEETVSMFKRAKEPKELFIIPKEKWPSHFDVETELKKYEITWNEVMSKEIKWLHEHLPPL